MPVLNPQTAHSNRKSRAVLARIVTIMLLIILAACAATPVPPRIALLAPFEGRARAVGYDALYAARLALQDASLSNVDLLPVDDGGSPLRARDRLLALASDAQIIAAVILGPSAAQADVLAARGDLPLLVVGTWGTALNDGGDPALTDALFYDGLRVDRSPSITEFQSHAAPLNPAFVERYRALSPFTPPPTPLAGLTHAAVARLIEALAAEPTRSGLAARLPPQETPGLPPLYTYRIEANTVSPLPSP